jgi:hypothetical protein
MSPIEALNAHLVERFGLGLEDVLDAATGPRLPAQLSASVASTAQRLDWWRDEDGAVTELYEGVLTLEGVRYAWRASFFTDLDGERFVGDIAEMKPLDWRTSVRLAEPPR